MPKTTDGCPSRHSKPVCGSCAICRKTVCPDCKAPIASELSGKLVCKFCYEELNNIQQKINDSFENKVEKHLSFMDSISIYLFGETEEVCDSYKHIGDKIVGICIACRKNVCEKCLETTKKLSNGGCMCKKCYASLYDVKGELSRERKNRFLGGFRELFKNLGRTTRLVLILSLVLISAFILLSSIVTWIFYEMNPASFELLGSDWGKGYYSYVFKEDIPDLIYELKNRGMFVWKHWGDPHASFDEENRKIKEQEYINIFQVAPEEKKSNKDIDEEIREYKKAIIEQEKASK